MADVTIGLIVLRTAQIEATLAFYHVLGLSFIEEQHGSGPIHYSSTINGVVIEIYPGKPGEKIDYRTGGATMIGFVVKALDETIASLAGLGARIITAPKTTQWEKRAVMEDPDGRAIEITQI